MKSEPVKYNFAVIGNPVEHSLGPVLHSALAEHINLNLSYSKIRVKSESLVDIIFDLKSGKYDGINITLPLKQQMVEFLDECDLAVNQTQATNCIRSIDGVLKGINTDCSGFDYLLKINNIDMTNKKCVIVGAGGAARAVLFSLNNFKINELVIGNRTAAHAKKLYEVSKTWEKNFPVSVKQLENIRDACEAADVIINCTSVGLFPDITKSPIPREYINSNQILIDTIYAPLKTQFLKFGDMNSARVINGLDMFIAQGIASLEFWTDQSIFNKINFQSIKNILSESI